MPSTASLFFRMMSLQGKVALSQLGIARVFEASKSKVCQSCRYSDLNRTSSAQTLPCTRLFFQPLATTILQMNNARACNQRSMPSVSAYHRCQGAVISWSWCGAGGEHHVSCRNPEVQRLLCSTGGGVKKNQPWNEHKTDFWGCHCNLLTSFFSSGC